MKRITIPEKHRLRIAKDTMRLSEAGVKIMGGMTKEEASRILTIQKIAREAEAQGA